MRRLGPVAVSLLLMWFGYDLISRDETECAAMTLRGRGYSCLSEEELDRGARGGTVSPDAVGSVVLGAGVLVVIEAGWMTYRDRTRRFRLVTGEPPDVGPRS